MKLVVLYLYHKNQRKELLLNNIFYPLWAVHQKGYIAAEFFLLFHQIKLTDTIS